MGNRIAAVHLFALPLECVFGDECIAQSPCAVQAEIKGRLFLIGLSDAARQAGLSPNMTLSEGKARLAALQVRPRNSTREVERLHAAAELLMAFGPYVEVGPPNMLWVEIGRGERERAHRLGDDSEEVAARIIVETFKKVGHRVTVAIASDPSTARTFAQHLAQQRWVSAPSRSATLRRRQRARGGAPKKNRKAKAVSDFTVISDTQTASRLGPLPLDALLWTDKYDDPDGRTRQRLQEIAGSLRLLGIQSVARLASLPAAQVSSRFGDAGALLARRAVGAEHRPLRPFIPPDRLAESFELDSVTEDLEPILFVLRRLFSRLEARLEARKLATTDVRLHFTIEPGLTQAIDPQAPKSKSSRRQVNLPLVLARPTRQAKTLLAVAREKLDGQLPGAVWGVEVEAQAPSRDDGAQLDLFSLYARKVEDVSELISRLQAALGPQAVFSPQLEDTHRPEAAWSLSVFDIERALAEPETTKSKKTETANLDAPALEPANRILYALPSVDDGLSVTGEEQLTARGRAGQGTARGRDGQLTARGRDEQLTARGRAGQGTARGRAEGLADLMKADRPWPKPVARRQEDEPLPPLPPRPMALFERPERASVLKSTGLDEGVLVWRGQRHHLVTMTASEHLEAEWWSPRPLDRDYVVAEIADGRRFWLFFDPQGETFVHGVFD